MQIGVGLGGGKAMSVAVGMDVGIWVGSEIGVLIGLPAVSIGVSATHPTQNNNQRTSNRGSFTVELIPPLQTKIRFHARHILTNYIPN